MKKICISSVLILLAVVFCSMTALGLFCGLYLLRDNVSADQRWPATVIVIGCAVADYMLVCAAHEIIKRR